MAQKKGELSVKAFAFDSGCSLEELRARLGEEEYHRRLLLCQERALAAAGFDRDEEEPHNEGQ